ncbi:MAG: hypothetical protein Q8P01_01380 [bacterium]|nr:hypothetical protein [bacterium]
MEMEKTNKKECTKCGSTKIFYAGARMSEVSRVEPGAPTPEADQLFYECEDCKNMFIFKQN